jgi:hypothetical protein
MSPGAQLGELHQLIADLRVCAKSLASIYGDCPTTRRIVNDAERVINGIERIDIDVEELELSRRLNQHTTPSQMIPIPDTQYDIEFWKGVDDEGIGGHGLRR